MSEDGCRIDVWLWRARFFKTRSLAAKFVDEGRIRLTRPEGDTRIDKPSRAVRIGDGLVFAIGGKVTAIRIEDRGLRRGPPSEARLLYSPLEESLSGGTE